MKLSRLASHERNLFAALYLMFGSVLRTLPVSLGSSLTGPLMLIHYGYRERVFYRSCLNGSGSLYTVSS